MSLINCPECGKEISDTTDNCIHCGYKLNKSGEPNKKLLVIGVMILIMFITGIITFSIKEEDNEELVSCYDTDYFYKIIKDEIHDEYWEYDDINIKGCNSTLLNGELTAWCSFEYRKTSTSDYIPRVIEKEFKCAHERK